MVGPPEVQRCTPNDIDFQIESDFIGLMTPGPAPRGQQVRRPRRPRDELRRRPLRRHVLRGHVRGGLLRERPAQGGGDGPALDPRRERLRADHPRRARLVRAAPGRLDEDLAARPGQVGQRRPLPGRRAQPPSTSTRGSTARYVALGLLYGSGDFAKTLEVVHPRRPGLRLQPVERGRHPGRHARLRRASPTVWKAGIPAARRQEVRLHALLVQRDRAPAPWPAPTRSSRAPAGRSPPPRSWSRRRSRRRAAARAVGRWTCP